MVHNLCSWMRNLSNITGKEGKLTSLRYLDNSLCGIRYSTDICHVLGFIIQWPLSLCLQYQHSLWNTRDNLAMPADLVLFQRAFQRRFEVFLSKYPLYAAVVVAAMSRP